MKQVDRLKAFHHRERADAFYKGMQLLGDDLAHYGNAVALLAVHTAISLTDAVLVGRTGSRSTGETHGEVIDELRRLCGRDRLDVRGIQHLAWLLERKTRLAYGDDRLDLKGDIELAKAKAERFTAWVYSTFREFAREDQS
jgi:hypothetical protein